MGSACSKKDESTLNPPNTQENQQRDESQEEIEKQLKLQEQKFINAKDMHNLCLKIADYQQNNTEKQSQYVKDLTQELKQKLQAIKDQETKVQEQINGAQNLKEDMKNTVNKKEQGKKIQIARTQIKQLENSIQTFINSIKEINDSWVNGLFTENLKKKLLSKLEKQSSKIKDQQKQLQSVIQHGQDCKDKYEQYLREVVSQDQYKQYEAIINPLIQDIEYFDKQIQSGKSKLKETLKQQQIDEQQLLNITLKNTFDEISDFASTQQQTLDTLKENQRNIQSLGQYLDTRIDLIEDFDLKAKVTALQQDFNLQVIEALSKTEDSLNAFKQIIEDDLLSTLDEEQIQEVKGIQEDIQEQFSLLEPIKQEIQFTQQEIKKLADIFKQGTSEIIDNEVFKNCLTTLIEVSQKTDNLRKQITDVDKETELIKVETGKVEIKNKMYVTSSMIDTQGNQFDEFIQECNDLDQSMSKIIEILDQNENPFAKILLKQFKIHQKTLIKNSEPEVINSLFNEVEMQINTLMNFWTDKEESGTGISSAEDAKYLIDQVSKLEDLQSNLDGKVTKYKTFVYTYRLLFKILLQRTQAFVSRLFKLDQKTFESYQEGMKVSVKQNNFKFQEKWIFQELCSKFNEMDLTTEDTKVLESRGTQMVNYLNQLYKSLVDYYNKLSEVSEYTQITLQWDSNGKLLLETTKGQEPIDIKFHKYISNNSEDQTEKELVRQSEIDPKVQTLPIQKITANTFKFGNSFEAKLIKVDGKLCAELEEGLLPFEDFVTLQYLQILEKEMKKPLQNVIEDFFSNHGIDVKALKDVS